MKKKMQKEQTIFFAYSWHLDPIQTQSTVIRIYGLTEKNENICIIVEDFLPYCYIELPDSITWSRTKTNQLIEKLNDLLKEKRPVNYRFEMKKRLYYANITEKGEKKLFPYLLCYCSCVEDIKQLSYKVRRPIRVGIAGQLNLKLHEDNATPIIQLTCQRLLPTAGWIKGLGKKVPKEYQQTTCDYEYRISWKDLFPYEKNSVGRPLLMGFDLEVNSSVPSSMPKAGRTDDKVFQISCVFSLQGSKEVEKILLTLGEPDPLEGCEIRCYETESELLMGFTDILQEKQPNVCIGYNIFDFDIPYLINRAKHHNIITDFDKQSFLKDSHSREKTIKWSSSAYKNQSFQFLDVEGRIFVDLLPLVKRDHRLANYQLKTVAANFLQGITKDPLDAKGIFKCYRLGMQGGEKGRKALALVGKYCIQDSYLVVRLFEVLTTWIALCEMSKVTGVPIFSLYTQGQQIKIFSQVYRKSTHENIVVEKNAYVVKDSDYYVGATVVQPKPGVYDNVAPEDFSAMYPSIIIAYNMCFSTLVTDDNVPDSMCHVHKWKDCVSCLIKGSKITIQDHSILIENLEKYKDTLLTFNEEKNGFEQQKMLKFLPKGKKPCIKLTFEDGTTLSCTPDHRILLNSGEWKEAGKIELHKERVVCGYSPPCYDTKDSLLIIDGFSLSDIKLVKFMKLLGLLVTDGLCNNNQATFSLGHMIDVHNVMKDLNEVIPDCCYFRKQNYGWKVITKGKLKNIFKNFPDMIWGKKSTQKRIFPSIIFDLEKGVQAAFLGGLFGGDGCTSCWSKAAKSISPINFGWTGTKENTVDFFTQLQKLLLTFEIRSTITYAKGKTRLLIAVQDTIKFKEQIGFSYCVHKSTRLEAACVYFRRRDSIWNQRKEFVRRVSVLEQTMPKGNKTRRKNIQAAMDIVKEDLRKGPIFSEIVINMTVNKMYEALRFRSEDSKPMFSLDILPYAIDYMEEIGAKQFFVSELNDGEVQYSVPRDKEVTPSFHKKVIHIENIGEHEVYDLSIENNHNFIANGVVVHNCEHDPAVIRKKQVIEELKKGEEKMSKLRKERDLRENKGNKEYYNKKIISIKNSLKPLREERSQLNKSKPKHIICENRKYRWLKQPIGVLPEILSNLLTTRSATKKELAKVEEKLKNMKEEDPGYYEMCVLRDVLDQRQNALKVSANSGYGITGARKGYLTCMPVAMCTTYMGRKSIQLASETIQNKFKGVLVYGDTDSNYISFPHLKSTQEIWDYADLVAKEVTKLFPPPMSLAFEKKIYARFLIITKKRYMSLACDRDGKFKIDKDTGKPVISKKGVLLQRRDNCKFVRKVYEDVIMSIFDKKPVEEIMYNIIVELNKLCSGCFPSTDFIISKSIGEMDFHPTEHEDEKGKTIYKLGDYKLRDKDLLPSDEDEKTKKIYDSGFENEKEYYLSKLPGQAQLGEKMRERGQLVSAGSRIEYIITTNGGHTAKQYEKIEDADYFRRHSASLKIDYLYYLKQLSTPLDQVLDIIYGKDPKYKKGFVTNQYKYRYKVREKMIESISEITAPKIFIIED